MSFDGKVALVAGGTGGLGRAITAAFLAAGARVVVTYRQQAEFDTVLLEAGERAEALEGHVLDATDQEAARAFVEQLASRLGRLDILVNAVGGYEGGTRLWELDSGVLDKMLDLNLRSGFVMARAAIPVIPRPGGSSMFSPDTTPR